MPLPLALDVVSLTMGLVNVESLTGAEGPLADSVEQALRTLPHLDVERFGDTVVARSALGRAERVVVAGHLDTVPGDGEDEVLAYVEMGRLFGLGACDAKGGLAVALKVAALADTGRDATYVFWSGEEGDGESGLEALARKRPDVLRGDLAVVLEPTGAGVEVDDELGESAAVAAFASALGTEPVPATDRTAARLLAGLGTPAVTFGPGDPLLAHTREEHVPTAQLTECEHLLRTWVAG
ncbi:M20/M25/M40 family metallo-hydrolase [Nocardioides anomalus]|uniref:M20/M25/M40 family metallo-hydrolase n=2 Tax=Nocardioides anomalus TaxID=2712223 RepID=A0A6G6WKN6_9ACTN|nr:M20/M25/M40 family metallo-hydrolase [Nocardioides anomalus]